MERIKCEIKKRKIRKKGEGMIEFKNVRKNFKDKTVIKDLNLTIEDEQLVAIIGASGCGKTTTLKMINRLIDPTSGTILIDGQDINKMNKTELRRKIGYVIQQMGLFPHMTVRENIELIQKLEKKDPKIIEKNTEKLMEIMDLDGDEYLDKYPQDLSGGQQQRIGVARALANNPSIVLMDEPFSALDPITRQSLQNEVRRLQEKMKTTIVFVTHDMDEAIKIADKICIMKDGVVVQYDQPEVILKHPANDYVRDFIGKNRIWDSPEMIQIRDIMIDNPITCQPDFTREECIEKMVAHHVDTLMVIEKTKHFLGIVNRKGLYMTQNRKARADEIMHRKFFTANPEQNIVEVLRQIEEYDVTTVPVVNDDGTLAGLMTSSSLISALGSQYIDDDDVTSGKGEE